MKLEGHSIELGVGSNSPLRPELGVASNSPSSHMSCYAFTMSIQYLRREVNDLSRSSRSTECPHPVSTAPSRSTYHTAGNAVDVGHCLFHEVCHRSDKQTRSVAAVTVVCRNVSPQSLRQLRRFILQREGVRPVCASTNDPRGTG